MTNLAIFEIVAFILALPLSYLVAWLARKYSRLNYKDELNRLFLAYWDGEEENELYAWLRVKQLLSARKLDKKRRKYLNRKIRELNKTGIYAGVNIDQEGRLGELAQEEPSS